MTIGYVRKFKLLADFPIEAQQLMCDHLTRAIQIMRGNAELARALCISPSAISQWDVAPPQHCREIEYRTDGAVTRYQLRPDIFGQSAT